MAVELRHKDRAELVEFARYLHYRGLLGRSDGGEWLSFFADPDLWVEEREAGDLWAAYQRETA
jgi:hypothetical protein